MSKKKGIGFLIGAGIGAGITALFTTSKGKEYQKKITELCDDIIEKIKNIDADDVKENVTKKINDIKEGLADLDKEKVKEEAAKKAKKLQAKSNELLEYAKDKGIPTLKEAAINLCKETEKASKKIMKKLESSKKEDE